jgi:hypothetical protein
MTEKACQGGSKQGTLTEGEVSTVYLLIKVAYFVKRYIKISIEKRADVN